MDVLHIEGFFLDHDEPYYEMIGDADSLKDAMEIGREALADMKIKFKDADLETVVRRIRGEIK
jgi:hypothetical protein